MWCNHPFSQRNKRTKRAVGVEVGGDGKGVAGSKLEKGGSSQKIGGMKIVGKK